MPVSLVTQLLNIMVVGLQQVVISRASQIPIIFGDTVSPIPIIHGDISCKKFL